MKHRIKHFYEYDIPEDYRNIVEMYFDDAKRILGSNMIMFMLTSSCSLNQCLEGWSDIDILIVVNNLDFRLLKIMHEEALKYTIKIALAMLSKHEIMTRMFDDKTNVVFYQISSNMSFPNYIVDDLILPNVTLEQIQHDDKVMLPSYLHKLRRLLFLPSDDKRSIIKTLYIVIKMKLRERGIIAVSYEEAYSIFAKEFNLNRISITSEMLSDEPLSDEYLVFARKTVTSICNGEF